jgi:hypothetical protein
MEIGPESHRYGFRPEDRPRRPRGSALRIVPDVPALTICPADPIPCRLAKHRPPSVIGQRHTESSVDSAGHDVVLIRFGPPDYAVTFQRHPGASERLRPCRRVSVPFRAARGLSSGITVPLLGHARQTVYPALYHAGTWSISGTVLARLLAPDRSLRAVGSHIEIGP